MRRESTRSTTRQGHTRGQNPFTARDRIEDTIAVYCAQQGLKYEAEMEAWWRIENWEAAEAGISADEAFALVGPSPDRYRSFVVLSRGLQQHARQRLRDDAQALRALRVRSRESGRRGGAQPKPIAEDLRTKVKEYATVYRRRHPYHRYRSSTTALITAMAAQFNRHPDTIRRHLRALRLK